MDKQLFFTVWDLPELRALIRSFMWPGRKSATWYEYFDTEAACRWGYFPIVHRLINYTGEECLCAAAANNHANILPMLILRATPASMEKALNAAARAKASLCVTQLLASYATQADDDNMYSALAGGDGAICDSIYTRYDKKTIPISDKLIHSIIEGGIGAIGWWNSTGRADEIREHLLQRGSIELAAKLDDVSSLSYIMSLSPEIVTTTIMRTKVSSTVGRWLFTMGLVNENIQYSGCDTIDSVSWIARADIDSREAIIHFASCGDLASVKWLVENIPPRSTDGILLVAMTKKHEELSLFLVKRYYTDGGELLIDAIEAGASVIRFIISRSCISVDSTDIDYALSLDDPETLQLLCGVFNDDPSKILLDNALDNRDTSSLEVVYGFFGASLRPAKMPRTKEEFNVRCADWLYERGLLWLGIDHLVHKPARIMAYAISKQPCASKMNTMPALARFGELEKLKTLLSFGYRPSQLVMDAATVERPLQKEIVLLLRDNYEMRVSEARVDSMLLCDFPSAKWLIENDAGDCSRDFLVSLTHDISSPGEVFSLLLQHSAATRQSLYNSKGSEFRRNMVNEFIALRGLQCSA